MASDFEQREVHFQGEVQGVGFRMKAQNLAQGRPLTGYVQNRPDGQVELVLEGAAGDIDAYLLALRQDMARYIEGVDVVSRAPTGQFRQFEIRN